LLVYAAERYQMPPCRFGSVEAKLNVTRGVTAEVEVEVFLEGTWTGGSACPIDGAPFNAECGVSIATGRATLVGDGSCRNLGDYPCP